MPREFVLEENEVLPNHTVFEKKEKVRLHRKQPGTLTCLDRHLFPRDNFFGSTDQCQHRKPLLHYRKQKGEDFARWKRDDPVGNKYNVGIRTDYWEVLNVPGNIPVSRAPSERDDVIEGLGDAEEMNIGN